MGLDAGDRDRRSRAGGDHFRRAAGHRRLGDRPLVGINMLFGGTSLIAIALHARASEPAATKTAFGAARQRAKMLQLCDTAVMRAAAAVMILQSNRPILQV